jgi:hypothetical protein
MRETLSLVTTRLLGGVVLVAAAGFGLARCGQAIVTAPRGSLLRMEANPPFIEANGGVSVISVAVIEPTGTVVPDGTVVQFFTTLGRIDEQGKTNDGVARVNLVSSGLSGLASVTAVSGGQAAPPSSSTTPGSTTTSSTTPTSTSTTRPGGPGQTSSPRFGFAEGTASVTMTVAIGNGRPVRVTVVSDSPRVSAGRPVRITVFVLDEFGNPVANVPVFLKLEVPTATERLDSAGNPLFTDFNGVVVDSLSTTAPTTAPSRNVNVVATTANGVTGNVVVAVN